MLVARMTLGEGALVEETLLEETLLVVGLVCTAARGGKMKFE